MSDDDPFGLKSDAGRTRIRPKTRRAAQQTPKSGPLGTPPSQVATGSTRLQDSRASDNPLINAFSPLLGLAPELEAASPPSNADVLRERMVENVTDARDAAVTAGVPLNGADKAAWFVAALLDDIALNTPWGAASSWPRMPLVAQLYGNVDAGTRFFDLTQDLMAYPDRDPHLLELAYLCLSLGFRGKYRITADGGEADILRLRHQMARAQDSKEVLDTPLSPFWQGVVAEDENRGFVVPVWAVGVVAAALILGIYTVMSISLSNRGEQLYALSEILPPPERAGIFRPVIETVAEPAPLATPFQLELLPLFASAAPEDTVRALTGREDVSLAVLVVQATQPEVFRSAKADLNTEYNALIASVAGVILENAEFVGQVRVVGHTDSIPVQRSNPFQSNQRLSEARAEAIAQLLVQAGISADLIQFEGRAAAEPIADNGTREGRARNRRVEIIIQKKV